MLSGDFLNRVRYKIAREVAAGRLPHLTRFRDSHRGESCYLFGDGSSIKYFDLHAFADRPGLCCNYFLFHKDFRELRVQYAAMMAPFYLFPFRKNPYPPFQWLPNKIQRLYHDCMREFSDVEFFLNYTNALSVREQNVTYLSELWVDPSLPADHLLRQFNCWADSFRALIGLATYMGFRKAYLVGFDYTHRSGRALHWYERGEPPLEGKKGYQSDFLPIATKHIEIVAVTLEGDSEFIESIEYEKLTGQKPSYHENDQLVRDERFLKYLATVPGYVL